MAADARPDPPAWLAPEAPERGNPFFERWLREHGEESWEARAEMPMRDEPRAEALLASFVDYACRFTDTGAIDVGRYGAATMPRAWVLARVERIAATVVDLGDPTWGEWEFDRLVELYLVLVADEARARLLVDAGGHPNPAVRVAAVEWRGPPSG